MIALLGQLLRIPIDSIALQKLPLPYRVAIDPEFVALSAIYDFIYLTCTFRTGVHLILVEIVRGARFGLLITRLSAFSFWKEVNLQSRSRWALFKRWLLHAAHSFSGWRIDFSLISTKGRKFNFAPPAKRSRRKRKYSNARPVVGVDAGFQGVENSWYDGEIARTVFENVRKDSVALCESYSA